MNSDELSKNTLLKDVDIIDLITCRMINPKYNNYEDSDMYIDILNYSSKSIKKFITYFDYDDGQIHLEFRIGDDVIYTIIIDHNTYQNVADDIKDIEENTPLEIGEKLTPFKIGKTTFCYDYDTHRIKIVYYKAHTSFYISIDLFENLIRMLNKFSELYTDSIDDSMLM